MATTMGTQRSARAEPALPADVLALVEAEVARQVKAAREEIDSELRAIRERTLEDRAALVVFSGDLDKVLAAFVIATGAAAAGLQTSMFFTFWGLSALRKESAAAPPKNFKQRLMAAMTPASSKELGTSKMNYFGVGAWMFRRMMQEREISSLEELIALARELGVKMTACLMSMDVLGITEGELVDGLEYGGVAAFLGDASSARLSLFI